MTEMTDQQRLDADVAELKKAFADEVSALKAQVANHPDIPARALDFSSLEDLVATVKAGNVPATPEPIPADHPSLATSAPEPGPIAPVQTSPFVDTDADAVGGQDTDGDADDQLPPPAGDVPSDAAPQPPVVNDQLPAQSSEATSAPATDAASVASPPNEITPTTE